MDLNELKTKIEDIERWHAQGRLHGCDLEGLDEDLREIEGSRQELTMAGDREFQGLLARFIHVDDEVSTWELEREHEDLAGADPAHDQGGRED